MEQQCKVMIVDDERRTRENLAKIIATRQDCRVVAQASDGQEALERVPHLRPDIVLCDIRMPQMNGIEFATAVKRSFPNTTIIFLSGYSDKEYLLAAVKLGVFDYIEKPITLEELHQVMDKAVAQHNLMASREEKKKRRAGMLRIYRKEIEEKLIVDLAEKCYSSGEIIDLFKRLQFRRAVQAEYYAVVIQLSIAKENRKDMLLLLLESLQMQCFERGIETISGVFHGMHLVLYVKNNAFSSWQVIDEIVEDIARVFEQNKISQVHLHTGVGQVVAHLGEIAHSYQNALEQSKLALFFGRAETVFFEKLVSQKELEQWASRCNTPTELLAVFAGARGFRHDQLTESIAKMLTENAPLGRLAKGALGPQGVLEKIGAFPTQQALQAWLVPLETTHHRESLHSREAVTTTHYLMDNVYALTEKEYANPDFGVAWLTEELSISGSYLSSLFRQNAKISLGQYITKYRLEQATSLLLKTPMKVYEVAQACGYRNENYFIRLFKKHYGTTPYAYREEPRE